MNLAGEYMDVVLALTFEWYDLRKCSTEVFKAKYNTFHKKYIIANYYYSITVSVFSIRLYVDLRKRLKWGIYDNHKLIPIKTIDVNNDQIWSPRIDIANRLHNFSPSTERELYSTVRFDGELRVIISESFFSNSQR